VTHFESTSEGVEQDGKEQEGTTAVETAGVLVEGERDEGVDQRKVPPIAMQLATHHGQVVEDGADDETHGDVSKQLTQSQTGIRLESPEASSQTDFDLFTVRQGVGRFGAAIRDGDESGVGVRSSVLFFLDHPIDPVYSRALGLLRTPRSQKLLVLLAAKGILLVVLVELDLQLLVSLAGLPPLVKLFRRPGHLILEALPGSPFFGAGKRGQKVGSGLLFGAVETHVDKELFRFGGRTKVDLVSVVQDDDLGEELFPDSKDTP
jgi:hypothetical protein